MTPRNYDVIIVGAGQAGCAAAYDLAEAGLDVLLLDRKAFPRVKPCAGALTVKALKRLRFSIAPVIRSVARELEMSLHQDQPKRFASAHPVAAMTVRAELDQFCLDQALAKGAQIRIVPDIEAISRNPGDVMLRVAGGDTLKARFVIGADGANSRVRRLIGLKPTPRALALEAHAPCPSGGPAPIMRFDFGAVAGGYGWVFPKGDHINVGLYSQDPAVTFSKADLAAYAVRALGGTRIECPVGYPLGIGAGRLRQDERRLFLVGDAGGFAEPMLGEGIHNAIASGQAAAQAIITAPEGRTAAAFAHNLRQTRADMNACAAAANWFYPASRLSFRVLSCRPARFALMRGFAAGKTFRQIAYSGAFTPLSAIAAVPSINETIWA